MFIIIRHGANEELLVNPDCSAMAFFAYIRQNASHGNIRLDRLSRFDLCDVNGQLRGIGRLAPTDSVLPLVTCSETYVPVLFDYPITNEDYVPYTPLLDSRDKLHEKIIGNMRKPKSGAHRRLATVDRDMAELQPRSRTDAMRSPLGSKSRRRESKGNQSKLKGDRH